MKIAHYSDTEPKHFESETVKGVAGRVLIGRDDGARNFCMRLFELSEGGYTPQHAHEWEHEIFIHAGRGEVKCEGRWVPVKEGYVVFIPGNEEHQIRNTSDEPLIFACLIPSGVPEI